MLAEENVAALTTAHDQHGVRTVVASCPHCFNTIRNEYPQSAWQKIDLSTDWWPILAEAGCAWSGPGDHVDVMATIRPPPRGGRSPEAAGEALRRALAMGGDEAFLVSDPALAGSDQWATARVLATALDRLAPDVALMGMASDDARGSLVPGSVAAMRNLPLLSFGAELMLADGTARIRRLTASGFDILEAPLPVVASVTDQVGEPRYASLKGIMAARRKPLETWSLADLGISTDELHGAALTRVVEARPPEAKAPTERIENVGADEAAGQVADWLAARKLI